MIRPTRATPQPLRTKPLANDLLRVFASRCQYKLSRHQACYSSGCTKQRYLSATRLLLTWPRELSSMDYPHTLPCCSTRTGACTPSPFVNPTTPKTKDERPQTATNMCVYVCLLCHCYAGNYVRAPCLLRLKPKVLPCPY